MSLFSIVCADASSSTWTVQVELLVEAAKETSVLLTMSLPELQSELSVQSHFISGRSLQRFALDINTVLFAQTSSGLLCPCFLSFFPNSRPYLLTCILPSFHQETDVLLWWPRDHGLRHGYNLTVRGQQDSVIVIEAKSKVRGHTYCLQSDVGCIQ